jgi:hypothetical protein
MPILRVSDSEASFLATNYPESGMGYQIFDAALSRINRRFFLTLNGEFVIPFSTRAELRIELGVVGVWGLDQLRERADRLSFDDEPRLVARQLDWRLAASLLDPEIATDQALSDIVRPQEVVGMQHLTEPRLYVRYSAFPNDRRVMSDGSFVAGTYATTYNDASMTPSGFAAVGRYALPSPLSAQFLFPIVTDASPVYVGTATPNYGQAGGGVEVLFPSGASPVAGRPHRISLD